jgi:hypothetical protein
LFFEDVILGPILPGYRSSIRIFLDPRQPAGLKHDGFYANITNALPCPTGVIFQHETLCLAPLRALRNLQVASREFEVFFGSLSSLRDDWFGRRLN